MQDIFIKVNLVSRIQLLHLHEVFDHGQLLEFKGRLKLVWLAELFPDQMLYHSRSPLFGLFFCSLAQVLPILGTGYVQAILLWPIVF